MTGAAAQPDRGIEPLVHAHAFALRRAHDTGRKAHGSLDLAYEVFARRVVASTCRRLLASGLDANEARVAHTLGRLAAADLFLAIACDEDVHGAWEALTREYVPRLRGLAKRHGASEAEADELARELPGTLASPPPSGEARTRIGTFDGSGNLFAWLAVILLRRLADRGRRAAKATPADLEGAGLPEPRADPAQKTIDDETADRLRAALGRAWTTLTAQEGLALLLKFRDGLKQKEIATLLGVGPPRVSRIVSAAVAKLRAELAVPTEDGTSWASLRGAVEEYMATLTKSRDHPSEEPFGNG